MFGIRRRLIGRIRWFNRWWIDRLTPETPATVAVPPPTTLPPKPVSVTSEETPNPDARKFTANVLIVPTGSISFSNRRAAAEHPIGREIFAVEGVKSLFATGDFLTVTREPGADWGAVAPAVEERLTHLLLAGG